MRTKLDLIVCYLADRDDGSAEPIRRELGEPSSEASLFLEGLRERSRAMIDPRSQDSLKAKAAPRGSIRPGATGRTPFPARWIPLAGAAAALVFIAAGVAWREQSARLKRLEAALARNVAESKDRIARLEFAQAAHPRSAPPPGRAPTTQFAAPPPIVLNPKDKASELLLARLEIGLAKLEERLNAPDGPQPEPVDTSATDQLRRDLGELQRDAAIRDKAFRKDLGEMRSTLREAIFWIRQLAAQSPAQIPVPIPFPVLPSVPTNGQNMGPLPGQGVAPGLDQLLPYLNQPHGQAGNSAPHQPAHGGHTQGAQR